MRQSSVSKRGGRRTVELASEAREDELDGFGGASGCRYDVAAHSSARSPVLLRVTIEDGLAGGASVNGRHASAGEMGHAVSLRTSWVKEVGGHLLLDSKFSVQNSSDGSETVGL